MLLIPGLLPAFSIYQLYLQIKYMKIWQQVLAQQMKPLISPILMIVYGLPTARGTGSLKHPRNVGASEESNSLE